MSPLQYSSPYTNLEVFPDNEIVKPSGSYLTTFQDEKPPSLLDIPVAPDSNFDSDNDDKNAPLSPQFDFFKNINLHSCEFKAKIVLTPFLLRLFEKGIAEQLHFFNSEDQNSDCMNHNFNETLGSCKDRVTSTRNPSLKFDDQPFINPSAVNNQPIIVPYFLLDQDIEAVPEFENNSDVAINDQHPVNEDHHEHMVPPEPSFFQDYTDDEIPIDDPEVWVVVDIEEDDTGIIVEEENPQGGEGNQNEGNDNGGNENDTEEPGYDNDEENEGNEENENDTEEPEYDDAEENDNDRDAMEDYNEDDDLVDDEFVYEPVPNDDMEDDDVEYDDSISPDDETGAINDQQAWKREFLGLLAQVLFDDDDEYNFTDESNEVEVETQQPEEIYPRVIVEHLPQFPPAPGVPIPTTLWTPEFF
ncbi:unnamed protein product [Arctia plantaginis]|uniref:Uncharacterized protein n=1 Tax=Arctia plantaginis TaxID=874455 RepID=A0A8S0Z268_ARCPL|nr:unnamed protein product [Arctia plantaginis]